MSTALARWSGKVVSPYFNVIYLQHTTFIHQRNDTQIMKIKLNLL